MQASSSPRPQIRELDLRHARRQHPLQIRQRQRDAALCRRIIRPRDMQEDRRPASATYRRIVPAQHAHDVIQRIVPPQRLMRPVIRQGHLAVVVRVIRIVAPAVIWRDRLLRHRACGRCHPVRPVQHSPQRQDASRRHPITLLLIRANAATPQRGAYHHPAHDQLPIGPHQRAHGSVQQVTESPRLGR